MATQRFTISEMELPNMDDIDIEMDMNTNQPNNINLGENNNFEWSGMNITKIVIIIVVLAFLGFNLLTYLGVTMDKIIGVILPMINRIFNFFGFNSIGEVAADGVTAAGTITKGAVNTAAGLTTGTVDIAAGTINSGVDVLEKTVGAAATQSVPASSKPVKKPVKEEKKQVVTEDDEYNAEPDDSNSNIQKGGPGGYCNVGSWKGIRSCIRVEDSGKCLSGEIFPTEEGCINPNLRV